MSILRETSTVPKALKKFLLIYGGKNPYSQPNWRVCQAADRAVIKAGNYRDWDENLSTAERGGLQFGTDLELLAEINARAAEMTTDELLGSTPPLLAQQYQNKPVREVTETRECPLYPGVHGWIVEKWFPAGSKMIGSREQWEACVGRDGRTPILGEYPEQGEYVSLWGPYPYLPSEGQLRQWIGSYFQGMEELYSTTPEQRALALGYEYEEAEDKRWKLRKREYDAVMKDEIKTVFRSGSLGMSRFRNELARRIGSNSHVPIL